MRVVLSGGEKATYRNVLIANNAPAIAMNLTQYTIPKTKEVNLKDLMGGADVYVYTSDGDEDINRFDSFIRQHADDITAVIGRPDYNGDWLGDKYVPLWNDENDLERLAYLCQKYGKVAISDRAITPKTSARIRQLQQRWNTALYGITSKVDTIESIEFDTVLVSSWTSVIRYGETQVWDGYGLRRYPAQKKDSSRRKHRSDIVRLGCNFDEIIADDVTENAKLAVRSWLSWNANSGAYYLSEDSDEDEFDDPETGQIVTTPPETLSSPNPVSTYSPITHTPVSTRHESERELLPVIGIETVVSKGSYDTPDGDQTEEVKGTEVKSVTYRNSGIRNCDSCYLASRCPAFREHSECAYEIPVEIKTKEQLRAVLRAMLEMQTSRVLFARFAEELEGQGMDTQLSAEMDRLFKLVKEFKDIEDTRDLIRFEMEAKSSSGVLSRIFGDKAAAKATELPNPMSAAEIDMAIINAEVIPD
jgi:nuclear transport factor 2 (NTF2) superfamily protein